MFRIDGIDVEERLDELMQPEPVRNALVAPEDRWRLGCRAGEDVDFAGTGLLGRHRGMRGSHDLELRQALFEEKAQPPLPLDVQVQIDLVDQQKTPCRQGVQALGERRPQ